MPELDLTFLAASGTLVSCLFLSRPTTAFGKALVYLGCLWVIFLGGVDLPITGSYETHKVSSLFTIIPLCAIGGLVLLGTPERRQVFVTLTALWGAVLAAVGIVAPNSAFIAEARRVAVDADPIMAGRAIAVASIVCLAYGLRATRRPWMLGLSFLLGGMTLASGSRGAVIALSCAALVLISRQLSRWARFWALLAGSALVFLLQQTLMSVVSGLHFVPERISDSDLWSSELRQQLMSHAFQTALHNPLGVGWGQWGDLLPPRLALHSTRQYPHNLFLEVAAEAGLIALCGVALVIVLVFRRYAHHDKHPRDLALLGMVTVAVLSAMVSDDINDGRLLWILIGLGLGLAANRGAASNRNASENSEGVPQRTACAGSRIRERCSASTWKGGVVDAAMTCRLSQADFRIRRIGTRPTRLLTQLESTR